MADERIKDFSSDNTDPIRDDCYMAIDSVAGGTEKSTLNAAIGGANFHVVTKESDLPAASGGVITLAANQLYLVRKGFTTANSIDLNGASLVAEANRNINIVYSESSGALFDGDMSGYLGRLIFTANGGGTGKVFNLDATVSGSGTLKVTECGFSSNSDIGIIKDYVFLKMSNCNFQGNTGGLELEDITVLEISDESWYSNNSATSNVTLTGAFSSLKINSGFYDVASGKNQFDLSGITSITSGVISGFARVGSGSLYTGSIPSNLSGFGKDGSETSRFNFDKRIGFVDYNDSTTSGTPITPTASTWTKLTNDKAGAFTNTSHLPDGVTDMWDTVNNQFDFSELSLGDQIDIRFDVTVTTSSSNSVVRQRVRFDIGGTPYDIEFDYAQVKTAAAIPFVRTHRFYMGNSGTINNPAEWQVWTDDASASVVVNGVYISVARY